ncbi:MAG: hypothetical protein GY799_08020 [Desulfobulbaceae bacterium]|nr:hypothetical protein [Desulfobulbaceae bacterium]
MYTKKQIYSNSCGAACILALSYDAKSAITVKGALGCSDLDTPNDVEKVIYYVSSGEEKKPFQPFNPNAGLDSLPSNLCRAAKIIGFTGVQVYMDSKNTISNTLTGFHKNEIHDVASEGGAVIKNAYDWENAGGRCLVLIAWKPFPNAGLHWVYSHNGNVMDPGSGTIMSAANFKTSISKTGDFGGICVVPA